ncbi:hypothetical protein Trydic_g12549 [Trypoxylus dichotomus]
MGLWCLTRLFERMQGLGPLNAKAVGREQKLNRSRSCHQFQEFRNSGMTKHGLLISIFMEKVNSKNGVNPKKDLVKFARYTPASLSRTIHYIFTPFNPPNRDSDAATLSRAEAADADMQTQQTITVFIPGPHRIRWEIRLTFPEPFSRNIHTSSYKREARLDTVDVKCSKHA